MATVALDLVANDEISAVAMRASKAMQELAKQQDRLEATAKKMGTSDLTAVSKAISLSDKRMAKEAADMAKGLAAERRAADKIAKLQDSIHAKAMKAQAAAKKKAEQAEIKAIKIREAADRKRIETTKKLLSGNLAEASGMGATGILAGAIAVGLLAAGAASVGLAAALGSAAAEAGKLRASSAAAMNVLTGGRGSEALALVDGLAVQLGMNIGKARDQFIAMRQAGADNSTSAAMLKLTADLNSVDRTGKLAEQAMAKVMSHKNADGTLNIKAARAEMALLAKQAGVTGTGIDSATARFTTLGGAMASLDNTKTQFLEKVWERIGPTIDRAAGSVAKWAESFLKSEKGAAFIDGIGNAFEFMIGGAGRAISIVSSLVDKFNEWSPVLEAVGFGILAAGTALAVTMIPAIVSAGVAMATAMVPFLVAAAPFIAIAAGAALVYAAFQRLPQIIEFLGNLFSSFTETAMGAGSAIVHGLIDGISGTAGLLMSKLKNLAGEAWSTFKSTLGISSPSKAFAELGKFSGEGYGLGFERGMPDTAEIANDAVPSPGDLATPQAAPAAASGGGDSLVFNINVNGAGQSGEDMARSIRREIDLALLAYQQSRGRA